jgi:hypothetical protein
MTAEQPFKDGSVLRVSYVYTHGYNLDQSLPRQQRAVDVRVAGSDGNDAADRHVRFGGNASV